MKNRFLWNVSPLVFLSTRTLEAATGYRGSIFVRGVGGGIVTGNSTQQGVAGWSALSCSACFILNHHKGEIRESLDFLPVLWPDPLRHFTVFDQRLGPESLFTEDCISLVVHES